MQNKEQSELLEKIFANVNSWLNFAEAKHAANIAFVVACLAMIISTDTMNILTCGICVLFILSGLCSLSSFYPVLKEGNNFLFYEKIKTYTGQNYLDEIKRSYFTTNSNIGDPYLLDLSEEIVINSKITSQKYRRFQYAIKLDLLAFVFLIVYFIWA